MRANCLKKLRHLDFIQRTGRNEEDRQLIRRIFQCADRASGRVGSLDIRKLFNSRLDRVTVIVHTVNNNGIFGPARQG
ncbi:hypothetical protein D3C72_2255120 [compost metagenome]